MTIRSGPLVLPFTVLVVGGCFFGGPEPGQEGELGNDRFTYACRVDSDAMCDEGSTVAQEPIYGLPVVALGSQFGLDTDGITTEARAANSRLKEDIVSATDGNVVFTAVQAGWTTVLSRTYDGAYVDLVHVLVKQPTGAKLFQRLASGEAWSSAAAALEVSSTTNAELRVAPVDGEEVLAGGLIVSWTTEPTGIVEILPKEGNNVVTVRALADGEATVTAALADFTATISVEVSGVGEGGGGGGQGGEGGGTGGAGGAGGGQ
jgi:hypothetical protein